MYPTLFISHGAPNIILSDSKSKRNFEKFALSLELPKYIIIVSAHYVTKDLKIISPEANKIMYDFYGFEDELYKVTYEINSDKSLTNNLIEKLKNENINISIDENRKSYDHGVWNVLALFYKKLDIPPPTGPGRNLQDFLEEDVDEKYYLTHEEIGRAVINCQ